jgi:1-phosphatidylinositol phosphodiesterase
MFEKFKFARNTALLGHGFATLILAAVTAVVAPGDVIAQIAIVDENVLTGGTCTRDPAPKEWVKYATRDWMASIPNSVKLHKISIPGTHDSGALFSGWGDDDPEISWVKCQSWSIEDQLKAGIRYLDIRVRRTGESFTIYHGRYDQHQDFDDVMKTITGFLSAHPSETILMRVKRETKITGEGKTFSWIWDHYMWDADHRYAEYLWKSGEGKRIPNIGSIRGKIVVLRNDKEIPDRWGLNYKDYRKDPSSIMKIQDGWKLSHTGHGDTITLKSKKRMIKDYISTASDEENNRLILNHLSGVGSFPGIETPLHVARETNPYTYDYIGDYEGPQILGVVIMDYPGPRLVYRIVKSNLRIAATPEPPKPDPRFIQSRSVAVGGEGGGAWDSDSSETVNQGHVSKVSICHGAYIDSIRLYYAGKPGKKFGGQGGRCDSWSVPPGEFITNIVVRHGKFIDSLQFVTNMGTESDSYGGSGGKEETIGDGHGGPLRTVKARSGKFVDSLEFVFGYPSFIKDVEYDLDAASKQLVLKAPQEIARQELRNDTDVPQQAIYTSRISRTETHWLSFGKALELGLTGELNIGIPKLGGGATVTVSATTTFSAEEGSEKSETATLEWSVPVNIPPRQVIIATSTVREAFLSVPFTYTLAYYRNGDKTNIVKEEKYDGVYQGVQWADLTHHYEQVP